MSWVFWIGSVALFFGIAFGESVATETENCAEDSGCDDSSSLLQTVSSAKLHGVDSPTEKPLQIVPVNADKPDFPDGPFDDVINSVEIVVTKVMNSSAPAGTDSIRAKKAWDQVYQLKDCDQVSQLPGLGCCKDAKDCSAFSTADQSKPVFATWGWKEQGCKAKNPDVCTLWKGCVGDGNLTEGAKLYFVPVVAAPPGETSPLATDPMAPYCIREHCNNTKFSLTKTTPKDAEKYCDDKFGPVWRKQTSGPTGGGVQFHAGSGIWECAHRNYQCDWAVCKIRICDAYCKTHSCGGA